MRKRMMSIVVILIAVVASAQSPRIIKVGGPQLATPNPPPPPPRLSDAVKAQLLKSLNLSGPGSAYFTLSPRITDVKGKGALIFEGAAEVSGYMTYAHWTTSIKGLWIVIRGEGAGHQYVMDCFVNSDVNDDFKLSDEKKNVLQTFAGNQTHLLFV